VKDKNYLYIIGACVFTYAFYLITQYFLTDGQMGVPLDDTWIHFQFADNFAKGYFFHFNIGQPVAGSTSPLWVVLLGAFSFISSNFIFNSIFLSAVFHLLSCIFIYKIALIIFSKRQSTKDNASFISLMIALLTVVSGRFVWAGLSGMETTVFTFMFIAAVYSHIINLEAKKFNLLPSLFIALATIARPEGFLLFGIYGLDVIIVGLKEKNLSKRIPGLFIGAAIFIVITAPYFIFSHFTSESILPTTFRGQGGHMRLLPDKDYVRVTIEFLLSDNSVTAILYFIAGFFYLFTIHRKYFNEYRNLNLIFLWIFLLPLVSSFIIPNFRHHGRYFIPLIPFLNLIAIYIFYVIRDSVRDIPIKGLLSKNYVLVIITCFSVFYYVTFAGAYGYNTQNINDQQVELAYWVEKNVPPDATIAVNDIGAITYISKNKVVDMAGLVTPQILRYRTYQWQDNLDSTYYLLKNNNVSYVIIYDHWFGPFLREYGECFEYVRSAILEDNTICGGEEMKVYKFHPLKEE
jgi:hypothetical protein